MEKYTPGPWRIDGRTISGPLHVVCDIWAEPSIGIERIDANVRLIAAAPDMLAALRDAVQQIEYMHEKFSGTGIGENVLSRARATIARATEAVR